MLESAFIELRGWNMGVFDCIPLVLAGGGGESGALELVPTIGIAIIAASIMVVVFNRMKQPALLAYIVAGFLLGALVAPMLGESAHTMESVSHLGLVFLLFIIGLEMDLRGILALGPKVATALLLQAPIAIAAIIGLQWLLSLAGIQIPGLGSNSSAWFIFAVAVALSSTAVVVRLLGEKFELDTQAGKATVLTLIGQDIWAVIALSYVASKVGGEGGGGTNALLMFGLAIVLVVVLILFAKHVISRIMLSLVKTPDLIALVSLGWCFVCALGISKVGLSAEMGALIAGLSLGSLSVSTEILAKVASLRDFFLALFFIALGMSLPSPNATMIIGALVLVVLTIIARLLLFAPTLLAAKMGHIVSFTTAVNLSQLSEFSLLIAPIGLAAGMLTAEETSTISYAMMISVVLSTYGIKHNYKISKALSAMLKRKESVEKIDKEAAKGEHVASGHGHGAEIVLLGYFQNAEAIMCYLRDDEPELLKKMLVIDFNLQNHAKIAAHGVRVAYGDISNPDTLRHFDISSAKVVMSTISNTFLRGTSNEKLLSGIKLVNPEIAFIATADNIGFAEALESQGAFACVAPPFEAAPRYVQCLKEALYRED